MNNKYENKSIYNVEDLLKNEDLIERFEIVRNKFMFQQKDFALKLNISKQVYNHAIQGKRQFKIDELFLLSQYFDINLNWLVLGKGDMLSSNQNNEFVSEVNRYFADQYYSENTLLSNLFDKIIDRMRSNTFMTKIIGENNTTVKLFMRMIIKNENLLFNSRNEFMYSLQNIETILNTKITQKNKNLIVKLIKEMPEEEFMLILKYKKYFVKSFLNKLDKLTRKRFFSEFETFIR